MARSEPRRAALDAAALTMKMLDPEVQAILQEELQEISIALLASPPAGSAVPLSALQDYSRRLNRLAAMVRPLQQPLLMEATDMALRNIQAWLRQGGGSAPQAMWRLIIAWPLEVDRYLGMHGSPKAAAELSAFLADADWPMPVSPAAAAPDPGEPEVDDALAGLPSAIFRNDLSLQIPPDVSQSLVVELLQELPDLTERLAHRIESWAEDRGNQDLLLEARRVAHTIKGAANVVGVRGVAVFTHLLEDVLDLPVPDGSDLPLLAVRGVACLQQMTDALLRRASTPAQAEAVANELLAALREARTPQPAATAPIVAHPEAAATEETAPSPAADADATAAQPPAPGLRVSPALVDDLFRLAGESTVSLHKLREVMQQSRQLLQQLTRRASSAIDHGHLLFPDTDARPVTYQPGEAHLRLQDLREAVADMMMIGEALQARYRDVEELMTQQERLSEELRHGTRQCRMLPAGEIAARLRRAVREAARQAGKQVILTIDGIETLIDAHVLNALFEPLMHAIRNAIDHGIESTERRRRAGKPPQGQLTVSFTHEGSDVVVRCADDGQGLDAARIRQRAIERQLIAEGDGLSDEALARLIFEPGFSTRDNASQTSGRGIGMSAIAAQVEAVKGIIEIHSEPGRGVRVEFRVPESLLSVGGLLVTSNGHTAGISSRGLQRVTMIDVRQLFGYADGHAVSMDGQTLPIHRLESLMFGGNVDAPFPESGQMPALVIRAGEINALVMVESIVATRALLIRRPGVYLDGFPALFGTTTLSDGTIVAVLDVVELLRTAPRWTPSAPANAESAAEAIAPLAWVIDDSAAVRREIAAQTASVGYGIRLSASGEEAVQQLSLPAPALVIVDADMPGLSGIDVCRRMRADGRFRTVPIVVLSARGEACRDAARAAGATLLLPKPCPRPILQRMLERYPVPPSNARIPYPNEESTAGERLQS